MDQAIKESFGSTVEQFKNLYDKVHPKGSDVYNKLIIEEFDELMEEDQPGSRDFKELCDLIWVCIMYAIEQGYPLADGMAELAREFQSKFVDGHPVYREDGKMLKGPNFKKADFEQFFR